MPNKGLLLVTMEPPAGLEDEFNDWYDTEHFPQRRGLPGFESASRWVCLTGWPRWLALYDLASVEALEAPEYKAVSGPASTPWSKRILPRTIGRMRVVAEQIVPGEALALPVGEVSGLILARYSPGGSEAALIADLQERAMRLPALSQFRVCRDVGIAGRDVWFLGELAHPIGLDVEKTGLHAVAGFGARMLNLYAPYFRG